jgi:hypothetical protein
MKVILIIGLILTLAACTATGGLDPAGQIAVAVACAADEVAHPGILAAATAAGGPVAGVADSAVYAGLSAACTAAIQPMVAQ